MEAEGREVVCACHRSRMQAQAAQWWVLASPDNPDRFLDYTFGPAGHSCRTARESLDTAVKLLCAHHSAEYRYLVIARL